MWNFQVAIVFIGAAENDRFTRGLNGHLSRFGSG